MALDQSTKITGWSFWNNNKLVDYGILQVDEEKHYIERIKEMCELIKLKINEVKPDLVCYEDIQYQKNLFTYKQLGQLQGSIMNILNELFIPFHIVEPTKWKSYAGIKGKKRKEQKENTVKKVKEKFNIDDISEDIADSIGIGFFIVNKVKI